MKSFVLLAALACVASAFGNSLEIREGLGIRVPSARRSVIHLDPVELSLVRGTFQAPHEGEGGWTKLTANEKGEFQGPVLGGGYVYCSVVVPGPKTALLEASGHTMVYVNGAPRAGDPYSFGYVSIPVSLHAGRNDFLFACGRGRLSAKLVDVEKPISLDLRDSTTPDIVKGEKGALWVAVVVRNATDRDVSGLSLEGTKLPTIPAMSVRKVGFKVKPVAKTLIHLTQGGKVLDEAPLELREREAGQCYKRTFVSGIDGSVQYYAVNPSTTKGDGQALFLSLHGASVEAIGQAEAYSSKSWGNLVAATNRRPYGFDWEEVGRLDALEVLALGKKEFKPAWDRIYLTGHSMGGHGTWQIGAHFPNLFAAIAPSAGWISFVSYAGGMRYSDKPMEQMLQRASSPSDTLGLKYNYATEGVYILHGDADDNVPVTEARTMRAELEKFHHDYAWHEEKGANHWWDASPAPGADAVDYAPMFEFLAKHRLPTIALRDDIDFTTASPGISSTLGWATIEQQEHPFQVGRVHLYIDRPSWRVEGTSSNVRRLALMTAPFQGWRSIEFDLDNQKLTVVPKGGTIYLEKTSAGWKVSKPLGSDQKNPARYGGFKDIYRNRFMFVYGTHGSPEENAWARNRARYDAETFWYRGNGSVDVVSDTEFDPKKDVDRNVVVYGNDRTNTTYRLLLGDVAKKFEGPDCGVLLIRPRPGSKIASVAGIGGTSIVGMRSTDRIPLFSSGAGIPDLLVVTPAMLEKGSDGIRAAGYFGNDWGVDTGDFVVATQSL